MRRIILIIPLLLTMSCSFIGKNIEKGANKDFIHTTNIRNVDIKKNKYKKLKQYTISKGETLYRISKNFDIPIEQLAAINNIQDATKIYVGQTIKVPDKYITKKYAIPPVKKPVYKDLNNDDFLKLWPLKNTSRINVIKKFGRIFDKDLKIFTMNNGLDIKLNDDNRVYSCAAGKVTYISFVRGVGKIVGVKLSGNYYLFYYPFNKISVKKGNFVNPGIILGTLSGNILHFEIRKGKQPLNPLLFLPLVQNGSN